jgi:hypothetical protein
VAGTGEQGFGGRRRVCTKCQFSVCKRHVCGQSWQPIDCRLRQLPYTEA